MGKPGVLQSMGSQRVIRSLVTERRQQIHILFFSVALHFFLMCMFPYVTMFCLPKGIYLSLK